MIALIDAYRAGLLAPRQWAPNIISGVIVGVVALPLAMAFAIASGAKPEQGIYTAIVAGILVSIFGGSRLQIAGPTGAFIVILADVVARHGIDGLQIATMMAGVILLLLGVARLGAVIKFIPAPVIVGFTAGIGVIIFVGQWSYFLGLPPGASAHFHEKLWGLLTALPQFDPATTAVGVFSLAVVLGVAKIRLLARVPGPLVALVSATLLLAVLKHTQLADWFGSVATIGSTFGELPRGLPSFQLPQLSMARLLELIGPAFAIAMLGAIESLLSAVVADRMAGTRHNSNQELIGQGIANIAAPLFGGFAATGAIARTATNIRNGGTGPIAGIVHGLVLVLILVALAPLASGIPLATLAAILFVVAWNMSEAKVMLFLLRTAPRADIFILLITFGLTVFADLVVAVNIGVLLAMLVFLRSMAQSVEVKPNSAEALAREFAPNGVEHIPAGVHVFSVEGPFFFGVADHVEQALANAPEGIHTLIIRMRNVPFIDATGLQALLDTIAHVQRKKIRVIVTESNKRVLRQMLRMGIVAKLGRSNVVQSIPVALRHIAAAAPAAGAKAKPQP